MSRKWQHGLLIGLCLLSLCLVAGRNAYGDDEGTIRGAAFLDANRNGKMDAGEKGVGWVYFTIRKGDYSHTYYSEWRETDSAGNTYATGTFGPAPLPMGTWEVQFDVPKGYVATTPTKHSVYVPGKAGGYVGYVYMGLYPVGGVRQGGVAAGGGSAGSLPPTGVSAPDPVVWGALGILGVGLLVSVAGGLAARRRF